MPIYIRAGTVTDDALVGAELEMALYAEIIEDEYRAQTLRRMVEGGCWGGDSAYWAELLATVETLRAIPPAAWARKLLEGP